MFVDAKNHGVVIARKPSSSHYFTRGWAKLYPEYSDTGEQGRPRNAIDGCVFLSPGVIDEQGNMQFDVISHGGFPGSVTLRFFVEYKCA